MKFEGQQGYWETEGQPEKPYREGGNSYIHLVRRNAETPILPSMHSSSSSTKLLMGKE
jgi:hypothetical protein